MADTNRGQNAEKPREIPTGGWKNIIVRAYGEVGSDSIGLVAAGVAFYGFLAIFPAISALVALSGLILEPAAIQTQFESVAAMVPDQAAEIILGQATSVADGAPANLGLVALFGLGVALWSASKGVGALMEGINIAYGEEEDRGAIHMALLRLGLTVALAVGLVLGLSAVVVLPTVLSIVNLGATAEAAIGVVRWIVLLGITFGALMLLYRVAASRDAARWHWLWPGAAFATVAWVAASAVFAFYTQNFGSYQETFGALAGVVILLMWLWISAYVVLFGAELNGEAEAQTGRDSTTGQRKPRGQRNAVKADTFVRSDT